MRSDFGVFPVSLTWRRELNHYFGPFVVSALNFQTWSSSDKKAGLPGTNQIFDRSFQFMCEIWWCTCLPGKDESTTISTGASVWICRIKKSYSVKDLAGE